jgi:hypothetical protein
VRWAALLAIGAALGADDPVVVKVGASEVRARELAFLLGKLHAFERESLGATPAAVRRGFVERRLVPELLFAERVRELGLNLQPEIESALVDALKQRLQSESDARLTPEAIRAYCRQSGVQSDAECDRDVWSYRVGLRRTRAHAELESLTRRLTSERVRGVDRALLDRLTVTPSGSVSALPAPAPERQKSE